VLNAKIDELYPAGATNQQIGLAWAWHSLTASLPLNAPNKVANQKYMEAIILMTDGMNTENRFGTTQSDIDAREQKLCNNIKAAGITIYTVLVMAGNSTVLKNCASDATKYFEVTTSSQLVTIFNKIGTELSQLRISK
jgi:hypothetical protein